MFWDLHSHVVPSGDDGVATEEEGLALCRVAAERGTSVLFATPHVWPHFELSREREAAVRAAHARMAVRAAAFALDLRLGWELTPAPPLLGADLVRYRLGDLPAVLMELPFDGPLGLAERLGMELEAAGLQPVVAHPERADEVLDDPDRARAYAARGWLLQVNATSLLGAHGSRPEALGWRLVESGAAAFVASDGHREARPPFLDAAYALVRARVGGARADALFGGHALKELQAAAPATEAASGI